MIKAVKLVLVIPFILSLGIFKLHAQDCDGLIYFRDVELRNEFDRVYNNHQINQDAINTMQQLRRETLDDRYWSVMSTGTAITNGGLATAFIFKNIQATCNLIGNLLKFNPEVGIVAKATKKTIFTAEQVLKTIEAGQQLKSIVDDGAEQVAAEDVMDMTGPVGQAVKTAWEFSKDMKEIVSMGEEQDELKAQVRRILFMLDAAVEKYQADVQKSSLRIRELNAIEAGITKYWMEHCKDHKSAGIPKKQHQPVAEYSNTESPGPAATGNAFYVFLTARLYVGGKFVYIISGPILHNGKLTDLLTGKKEQFVRQVESQWPDLPDDAKDALTRNDDEAVEVHYDKPWSKSLLESPGDVYGAIESYKQLTRNTYSSVGSDNMFEFRQLY